MAQQVRPPVVAILGHVDHGKTSLLDYIRKAHVASGEAGGITQHIGAYQAEFAGKLITFLDTPGHAAFSQMRSRGASVTDICILVVAADDGVMPQTVESIKYIRQAGVPMIVAINKIDVADAQPERVKAQLTEHEVYVTGYGGDTEVVELSAKEGLGVDTLLETIAMMGEILEVKADPDAELKAVVIESSRDKALGSVATLLVQDGTLTTRDSLFSETGPMGSVRVLTDAAGKTHTSVGPSTPIVVTGFKEVPSVGATITTVPQEIVAAVRKGSATLDFASMLASTTQKVLLIIKADVAGSLEAILDNLDDQRFEVVSSGLGDVNESDIQLAHTSGADIVAFQTKISGSLKKQAQRANVRVTLHKIIYELFEAMDKRYKHMTDPEFKEVVTGTAVLKQVFHMRGDVILGCAVHEGVLRRGDLVYIKRGDATLIEGKIDSLKQGKVNIETADTDTECGLVLKVTSSLPEFLAGDTIEAFSRSEMI